MAKAKKKSVIHKETKIKFSSNIASVLVNDFLLRQHYALRAMGICIQPVDAANNTVTVYIKKPCKLVLKLKE